MLKIMLSVLLLLAIVTLIIAYRVYGHDFSDLDKEDYKYKKFMFLGAFFAERVFHNAHLNWFPKNHLMVRQALSNIYGTSELEERIELYYIQKIGIFILVLFVFVFLAFFTAISITKPVSVTEIPRPSYDEYDKTESYNINISIPDQENVARTVSIDVNKRLPSLEEGKQLIEEHLDDLKKEMLAKNSDFEHIVYDLRLPDKLFYTGFEIYWNFEENTILSGNGKIVEHKELKESKKEVLTAKFYLDDKFYMSEQFPLVILTQEEGFNNEEKVDMAIAEFVERTNEENANEKIILPQWLVDKQIKLEWFDGSETGDVNKPLKYLLFGLVIAIAVYFMFDNELKTETEKRKNQLMMEFPSFVDRFVLLLNSGNSVNNALQMTLADIEEHNPEKLNNPLYRELQITYDEIFDAGISNVIAFENLGKRNQIQLLRSYATLVAQSIKKGDKHIADSLSELVKEAWLNKKNLAKDAGAKASSKLLVPMLILLSSIFILTMLPAFMNLTKL